MLRTANLLHPASTPASRPTPGASLPRTLASPRTGLAPAGHRELVARLCHDCSFALTAPELLDAQGFCRDICDRACGPQPTTTRGSRSFASVVNSDLSGVNREGRTWFPAKHRRFGRFAPKVGHSSVIYGHHGQNLRGYQARSVPYQSVASTNPARSAARRTADFCN